MSRTKIFIFSLLIILISAKYYLPHYKQKADIIAIANYGPHSSLETSIRGLKEGLSSLGFIEGRNISYEIADVNFDTSLIMQMLTKLKSKKPKLIVALSTPVAQATKNLIKDTPIVFMDITDPVGAGLLKEKHKSYENVTGATDTQDLNGMLQFAKSLSPNIKRVGMLYSTGEANDASLLELMNIAVANNAMSLVAIPIESARDISVRMHKFKDNVDMIYVGSSGAVQPALPTIVSLAEEMGIPVFNMNSEEVKEGRVFASYGVSFYKVGINASRIVANLLTGTNIKNLPPLHPLASDHEAFINKKRAEKIGFDLPKKMPGITFIEQ